MKKIALRNTLRPYNCQSSNARKTHTSAVHEGKIDSRVHEGKILKDMWSQFMMEKRQNYSNHTNLKSGLLAGHLIRNLIWWAELSRLQTRSAPKFSINSWHTGLNHKKPNKCIITKSSKKNYIESVHEEKKPHKWYICSYNFNIRTNMKKHEGSLHKGKKPDKCSVCDYTCNQPMIIWTYICNLYIKEKSHTNALFGFIVAFFDMVCGIRAWTKEVL